MATSAKFPTTILANADVGAEVADIKTAILSGAHNNSVTTITLTATVPAEWPTAGWVTIDGEIISYTGKSGSTLTSCTRGTQTAYGAGAAASHNDQSIVAPYLTAQAVNQIIVDLIAAQKSLFTQASANWTGAVTADFSLGLSVMRATTGNITGITLSNGVTNQWHSIVLKYGGAHTVVFTTTVLWANGTTPTFTSVNGKYDVISLFYDGTSWLGEFSGNH